MNEWTKERHEAAKALYSDEPELHVGAYCEEGDYFPICDRGNEVGRAGTMRTAEVFVNAAADAVDMLAKIEALTAALDRARALAKRARELSPYRHPCDIAEQDEAIESLCEVLGEPRPVALVGRMTPERLSEIREQFDNEGSVGARQEGEMLTEIERVRFLRRPAA